MFPGSPRAGERALALLIANMDLIKAQNNNEQHKARFTFHVHSHLSEEVISDQHKPTQTNLQILDVLKDMGLLHPFAAIWVKHMQLINV